MPNTGKPSKDCHLCRKRRVKCDLARPSCQRCIKYGAECPGYRDQQDLVFRDVDPAQSQAKRAKKREKRAEGVAQRQRTTPAPSSSSSSGSSSRGSTPAESVFTNAFDVPLLLPESVELISDGVGLTLTRPLYEHWTVHSVPILMNVYSTLDFLGMLYKTCPPDGPLVWAAHLFSRTYVTNLRYPTATSLEARKKTQKELGGYLGKTLSSVSEALRTTEGQNRDDVLATVWILSNYELLVGSLGRMEMASPWHLHTRGMYSILQARGTQALYTEVGRGTFWSAHSMIQVQCVLTGTAPPPESEGWLDIIRAERTPDEELALIVSTYINAACFEMARMSRIVRLEDYNAAAVEYDDIVTKLTKAKSKADAEFGRIRDLEEADPLGTYWRMLYTSTLVKVYHVVHSLINLLSHSLVFKLPYPIEQLMTQRRYCIDVVRASAQEILDYIPVVLDPLTIKSDRSPATLFNALKMIWPITSVFIIPSTLTEQKVKAEEALMYVGGQLGIRQALAAYPGFGRDWPAQAQVPKGLDWSENVEYVSRLGQADHGSHK